MGAGRAVVVRVRGRAIACAFAVLLVSGLTGAGAIAGGATGALTDPCKLNLGDPYWRDRSREEYERRCGRR